MAKLPTDDTRWVHTDLGDWQSAIYDIDTETPHNISTLDPLTNSTLRTLRNKGMEANAYLAYIVQNYDNLPSTIAFIHPHKDGYPIAWHTDNNEHSNVISLQTLNIDFIQSNGYANLRCVNDPGCPHEVIRLRSIEQSKQRCQMRGETCSTTPMYRTCWRPLAVRNLPYRAGKCRSDHWTHTENITRG
ncbi:unnamed protein product [Alternaria alternata]